MDSRFLICFACILSLLLIGFLIMQPHKPAVTLMKTKPITVETALVKEAMRAEQYATLGSLASLDSIDISSESLGQITGIYFKPGAFVEKGTLLIQLDDTILKNELASAQAKLTFSETNYQRIQTLAKRNLASAQVLDKALAELSQKQHAVNVKQAQLEKRSLRAPFAGTVGSRQISIGQYVKMGQALVHLVANQTLRVEYNLPERYIMRLQTGQCVQVVSDAFPKKIFQGKVNYIAPAIDKATRTIAVEALIANPQHMLSAGLFVRVNHQFGELKKRLLVPEESLIPSIHGQKIFVLHHHTAVAIPVEIAGYHDAMAEVTKGLKAGDQIVVRGQHKLKDGNEVISIAAQDKQ